MCRTLYLLVAAAAAALLVLPADVRAADGYQVLHSFGGAAGGEQPYAGVTVVGSRLFGTTNGGGTGGNGTIYSLESDGSDFQVVHSFNGANGSNPYAGLTLSGNTLYGTTVGGGLVDGGTVYKINTDGTGFETRHSFNNVTQRSPFAGVAVGGSVLYGATFGTLGEAVNTVYSVNASGSANHTNLHFFNGGPSDGDGAWSTPILIGSTLYGTTRNGGSGFAGTVYKVNTDGTGFELLHSFGGGTGSDPQGALLQVGSKLFGTTSLGGLGGNIYSLNLDGSDFQVLHEFLGPFLGDGAGPQAELIGDRLYGTTREGGANDLGTVFTIKPNGTGYQLLYSFTSAGGDGKFPSSTLAAIGNVLYGTTERGGTANQGTVFAILVPEPSSIALGAVALMALAWFGWRRRRATVR